MERLIDAAKNSARAFAHLLRNETAFRQEAAVLVAALPLAWLVSSSWRGFALLVGAVALVILVEVLNTGIEAVCNAVSREFNADIRIAKDCGSLAVLISVLLAAGVWLLALLEWGLGRPM